MLRDGQIQKISISIDGKYIYKFLVDGEWRFSPDQPTLADAQGNVNNMLDLTQFRSTLDETKDFRSHIVPEEELGQDIPSPEQYDQEPPYLPSQLRHIILNHTYNSTFIREHPGGPKWTLKRVPVNAGSECSSGSSWIENVLENSTFGALWGLVRKGHALPVFGQIRGVPFGVDFEISGSILGSLLEISGDNFGVDCVAV